MQEFCQNMCILIDVKALKKPESVFLQQDKKSFFKALSETENPWETVCVGGLLRRIPAQSTGTQNRFAQYLNTHDLNMLKQGGVTLSRYPVSKCLETRISIQAR